VVDAPTGHVTLGANMANGIEQKGIDSLQQCIKKCAAAGLGIPATVSIVFEVFYTDLYTKYKYKYYNRYLRSNCIPILIRGVVNAQFIANSDFL